MLAGVLESYLIVLYIDSIAFHDVQEAALIALKIPANSYEIYII
jgi:hypothetical protein